MDEFRNPLHDVPAELHELMQPLLSVAEEVGRTSADQVTKLHPLPWRSEDSEVIISAVVDEFEESLYRSTPHMTDLSATVMCRHFVATFSDRLEEIWTAWSGTSAGRA